MGKSIRKVDSEGLPIPASAMQDTATLDDEGLPIPKKKENSVSSPDSPSATTPISPKTEPSINTSVSGSDFKDHVTGNVPKDEQEYVSSVQEFVKDPHIQQTVDDKGTLIGKAAERVQKKYLDKGLGMLSVSPEKKSELDRRKTQLQQHYKDHSLTAEDMSFLTEGAPDIKDWNGMTLDQMATAINNKSKSLDKWQEAPTQKLVATTAAQIKDIKKKQDELSTRQAMVGDVKDYDTQMRDLKEQEVYARSSIQKAYNKEKEKLVPDLVDGLKKQLFESGDWNDIFENPNRAVKKVSSLPGLEGKSPLERSPGTKRLTVASDNYIRKYVDKELNKRGNNIVNAQVSGDVDAKKRTYEDISNSIVNYLNTIVPIQHAQDKYNKEFSEKNPRIKDVIEANKEYNNYFSKENLDAATSYVNTWRDKQFMKSQQKYFSDNGILNQNQEYVGINHRYAQRVANGTITEEIAKKQIDREIRQHPALKSIVDNYEKEAKGINDKTQKVYQDYIINGLRKTDPKLEIYKDGTVGVKGMTQEEHADLMKKYQEGFDDIAPSLSGEQESLRQTQASEKAKRVGPFWSSVGSSLNSLSGAFSKFVFNKTGWGGDKVRHFEAEQFSSPQSSQSDEAKRWNWKGVESLADPNFWLSKTGSMVPVIAGGTAIGLATEGEGVPQYISWLANAGLFTAQNGLETYNQLLSTTDAYGNQLTESDAAHYMANDMVSNFLPNLLMMAVTSGTLFRAKNIVKPTLGRAVLGGVKSAAVAQPFFTWQGYNSYANMLEAQGKKADMWDYMQSDDFKDNLVNGMIVGGGLSLLHAPGTYSKELKNWTNIIHSSEGEFKANTLYNMAMQHEMKGSGNYLRDALKLHLFNEGYGSPGEKADMEHVLQYSVALDRNLKGANLDPTNVRDMYQAHNLAMADLHDELSTQNESNKNLSKLYSDKAREYRDQAKAASDGSDKYHYLVDNSGNPIFLSDNSFKSLDKEGKIADWMKQGHIDYIVSSDDPEFGKKYKEQALGREPEANRPAMPSVTKEDQDTVIKAIQDNKDQLSGLVGTSIKSLIDVSSNHKDIVEGLISQGIDNPDQLRSAVGDDLFKTLEPIINKYKNKPTSEPGVTGESAVIKIGDKIYEGKDHGEAIAKAEAAGEDVSKIDREKDGMFKLSDGRIIDREQAMKEFGADHSEQLIKKGGPDAEKIREDQGIVPQVGQTDTGVQADSGGNVQQTEETGTKAGDQKDKVKPGDEVQWTSQGVDQFESPKIVKSISDDGKFAFVEGSDTGIPIDELKISSPKTDNNEKDSGKKDDQEGQSQGQKQQAEAEIKKGSTGDVTEGTEGGEKKDSEKETTPPSPPVSEGPRLVAASPKEEFTSVRKEKNAEIKGAKELFEKQKTITWTDTYNNALSSLQSMYPDHNLYDAMKARVGYFVAQLDSGILFNPTSEDIAVFNVFKNYTKRKISELPGWDSNEDAQRLAALNQFNALQEDLFNVVRVTNPGGEAGRAFNLLQSEIAKDPDHGLQIRRMELLKSKGGAKLSERDMEFTADQWEKERAIIQQEAALREKAMQERFDKQMADLKKQYEKTPPKQDEPKSKKEKLLSQKGKELADKIRGGKFKKGDTLVTFPGLPQAVNFVLDRIADLVEGGATLAEAIDNFIKEHKVKDKERFTDGLFKVFGKFEKREDVYAKIENMAKADRLTDINNSMVGKNLIRDYINSHVGLHDPDKVLEVATNGLKKILPDIESYRLREAYLKEGEFKQPTKKELEDSFKDRQRQFVNISRLQEDIEDLKAGKELNSRGPTSERERTDLEKKLSDQKDSLVKERDRVAKDLRKEDRDADKKTAKIAQLNSDIIRLKQRGELLKKSKGRSEKEVDSDIKKKQQELKKTMNEMGVKLAPTDKYAKASYEQRAKMHNDRIDALSKILQGKIEAGGIPDSHEKQLIKLKNQLDAVKIKLDERNKLSQEKVMDAGLQLLKSIKSEFARESDAVRSAEVNRALQKIIDKFTSDKDESEQDIKLQRTKDQAKREIEEYKRKIAAGEYEDKKPIVLTKTDAELIKLETQRTSIQQKFREKQSEYEKKNKPGFERMANFARSLVVDWMIGSPTTLLKVAGSAGLRPQFEAATKMTFGRGFEKLPFATTKAISERAKLGGESNSDAALKMAYKAYLGQYSPEQVDKLIVDSSNKYEKSSREYNKVKAEVDAMTDKSSPEFKEASGKLEKLKNTMNNDLVNAVGYGGVYSFIAGSSLKEGLTVLLHRTAMIERQFGQITQDQWSKFNKDMTKSDKFFTAVDNIDYVFDFIGRSHGALKNFSARFSFAAGFMARLEGAVRDGVDIGKPEKLLEIANESYVDWERGKYQESNWISDSWSKITNAIDKLGDKMGIAGYPPKVLSYLMRSDVAITRVPVNMLREGIVEYTAGSIVASVKAAREYYKAKNIVLNDGWTDTKSEEFKTALREQLQKIDSKQAATIMRCFRKGGFGLGLYALAILGHVAFGGFPHKGQTAEDKKKREREEDTGVHELPTGGISIGNWEVPETVAKIMEHTPAFQSVFFGLGLAQVYNNKIADGDTKPGAVIDDITAHVDHVLSSIPQIDKVFMPLAKGTIENLGIQKRLGEWNDVDTDGNPIKRKAFRPSDYLTLLPGISKKGVLTEDNYKLAVSTTNDYNSQIGDAMRDANLSKKEKEERRKELLKQKQEAIDQIYEGNKNNP